MHKLNNTMPISSISIVLSNEARGKKNYFFLCLFFLKRFLRLWVAILCLFLFFPLGMI